jgi:alpha-galactosidase
VLLAGFLTTRRAFGAVEVQVSGQRCTRLAAALDYDDLPLAPGDSLTTEPLWLAAGRNEHHLLATYAAAVGAAMCARVPARSPIGWCSWYYYFRGVTEDHIVENLQALRALRARFPCEYVQIDDGYQADIGDWLTANEKFPHGMAWMATQIRDAGFAAGIWTAPFIARSRSRLHAEHPDWFVQSGRGRPRFAVYNPLWGARGDCYALDTTHPEVLEWLRQTFRTITQEWGYRVLKLDFLYAAALPGRRHDPHVTRAQALRTGLEAVRAGAGNDAFLLGCGCPLGPAIGVVDAMRIGPDVAPFWTNFVSRVPGRDLHGLATKHAIRNALTRAFTHRRWWLNDPDCLMVRDTETTLTTEEVRSLATVIAATDGMIVLSDRVDQLANERVALLERTLALSGGQAEIVDLMHADVPELVVTRAAGRTLVAAFNFRDEPQRKRVDLNALGIRDLGSWSGEEWWTGASVPIVNGQADLGDLPPHACRVLVGPPGA